MCCCQPPTAPAAVGAFCSALSKSALPRGAVGHREGVLGALEFCAHRIAMKTDFELLQAVLSTVLKVHMGDIVGDRDLSDRAAEVREALGEAWGKMEGRLQRVTCLLSHFSNMN